MDGLLFSVGIKFNCSPLPRQVECAEIDVHHYFSSTAPCCLFKLPGDDAHSAYRHFPFTRFVADQMIKEATILQERGIVWMCEDPNLCVRENQAAHQVILQITLNSEAERFLHQT